MIASKYVAIAIALMASTSMAENVFADFQDSFKSAERGIHNSQQQIDFLTQRIRDGSFRSNADAVVAALTGLDAQIDNGILTVSEFLSPLTGGVSMAVGNFLLGPFVQSVTNGAEVMIGNLIGGGVDMVSAPVAASLSGNMSKLVKQANKYNVDSSKLIDLNKQLQEHIPKSTDKSKGKRDVFSDFQDSFKSAERGIHNSQQQIDFLTQRIRDGSFRSNADAVVAALTGLDAQIDNGILTVSEFLSPLTGGVSMAVGNFLLGPFVQSVTNGAEVMIGNLIGGGVDMVSAPVAASLSGNMSKLVKQANKYNVDTSKLIDLNNQLQEHIPKSTGKKAHKN